MAGRPNHHRLSYAAPLQTLSSYILLTSDRGRSGWSGLVGDPALASAGPNHLVSKPHMLLISGTSLRPQERHLGQGLQIETSVTSR